MQVFDLYFTLAMVSTRAATRLNDKMYSEAMYSFQTHVISPPLLIYNSHFRASKRTKKKIINIEVTL